MSTAYQRGLVLYNQGRYDLAAKELRQGLAQEPDHGFAHAVLAICLLNQDREADALREAEEAVRLEPGEAFSHYALGQVHRQARRYKEAESAAREAIRLEPAYADYHGLLASIEMGRRRWQEALTAAETGLALDPDHAACTNLRAMALVQLGRKDEADQTLGSALANDPENAVTHANQGWVLLHRGDHEKALEHFRESLRLDPELEWARSGIVEALKARYLIYRLMLRFFLWTSRQTRVAQWALVLGYVFGRKILGDLAAAHPALAPFIRPILTITFGFLLLTWISSPLFNGLLRLNRFGRLALLPDERRASSWIGGFFLVAAAFFLVNLVTDSIRSWIGMTFFGLLLLPLAVTFNADGGRPRRLMAAFTGLVALAGLPSLSMIMLDNLSPWRDVKTGVALFPYFFYGCILATWIPAFLGSRLSE